MKTNEQTKPQNNKEKKEDRKSILYFASRSHMNFTLWRICMLLLTYQAEKQSRQSGIDHLQDL